MKKSILGVTDVLASMMKGFVPMHVESKRKCQVFVDGIEIYPGEVLITHDTWALQVGTRPEGWPGFLFREKKGGGGFTIPWARDKDGKVLVGMVHEKRLNMGKEPVWCLMGGFVDPGETQDQTQAREAAEESGLDTRGAQKLPGAGLVSNRLFWIANVAKGEGGHVYHKEFSFDQLEQAEEGTYRPKGGIIKHGKKESPTVFFPAREAILESGDVFMHGAITKLLVHLAMV